MFEIHLSPEAVGEVNDLVARLTDSYQSVEDIHFMEYVATHSQELPVSLRAALNEFRLTEPAGACHITGFPVADRSAGPTPMHWAGREGSARTSREEFFFVLCASLLGDAFGWASQQGGRLVHEVVPIRGHEDLQINSASSSTLLWHTEDAFHPYRADYIGLMCIRNPGNIETTLACIQDVNLDSDVKEILFQPRFVLRPDESHMPKNSDPRIASDPKFERVIARSYARIEAMLNSPQKVPILFGDSSMPYIRLDSAEVEQPIDDPAAMTALGCLMSEIDCQLKGVVLRPGDVFFLDNYRAVHGRRPFDAKFDGRDRWLKRINVTRDLRRSRDARLTQTDRIVY